MSKCFGEFEELRDLISEESSEAGTKKKLVTEWYYGDDSSIENYIKSKLEMLQEDMLIEPTEEELRQLNRLKTTVAIDNLIHSIIERHWSEF